MSDEKKTVSSNRNDPAPLNSEGIFEEKGLKPAQNPPKMPEIKPAKTEKK